MGARGILKKEGEEREGERERGNGATANLTGSVTNLICCLKSIKAYATQVMLQGYFGQHNLLTVVKQILRSF